MKILRSMISAFLMYSKIPAPQVEWKEENRRYALCFFPLIGVVVGALLVLWQYVCNLIGAGDFLKGAVSALIPLIVTGGIHMDGFCDVIDARASYGDRTKKLEIMSDPHVGAFAVMWMCAYLILQTGLFTETGMKAAIVVSLGYVLSRALSGIAAVTFRSAKSEGSLQNFIKPAHKKITASVLCVVIISASVCMIVLIPVIGGLAVFGASMSLVYYRISSYKHFGGITGDLAGWFLQICEIAILISAVLGEKIMEVISG